MPGKKGKKGKKGGKKGKKGGKKAKKDASIKSMSTANSKMWEARLEVSEYSRNEYRENAHKLLLENDTLNQQMHDTEKDTIDVITYLKKQDQEKDKQMERLIEQIKDLKKEHRKEKETLLDDFQQQVSELESRLSQKTHEVEVMQSELKLVKEFRRKRAQMQKDLDEIKEAMFEANREHKDTMARMEHKFFEEKMRLQQEANKKIAELAERAHTEAITNLDETTRSVYKENVRISEALSYHMQEGDKLKKIRGRLDAENDNLKGETELNAMVIKDKVAETKHQKKFIAELRDKVETLETSLSHIVREFDTERKALITKAQIENEASKIEIAKLQRTVDLKTREMNKVKKLAKNILDQRTEMERFFLEALEQVKSEISANRMQYRHDAQLAYQQRMLQAHAGRGDYPKIRTFNKTEYSTNSVFKDLEAAERLMGINGSVDISDLTWEQKEKVLRFVFAKMNGAKDRRKTAPPALPPPESQEAWNEFDQGPDNTFLTQSHMDPTIDRLPSIHQSGTEVM